VADLFTLLLDEHAADSPAAAAAGAVAAGRSGGGGGGGVTHGTDAPTAERKLQWELWHAGTPTGKGEALAFARAKRAVYDLGGGAVDYGPRKLDTARCALQAANADAEDEDDEDEF
jgi:hypothetical protein